MEPNQMCFGLAEDLDKQSFACFLQLAGREEFASLLAGRVNSEEILKFVDSFTILLRKYLSEEEYHSEFLQDSSHSHDHSTSGDK